jgi:hypothetical protein
MKIVIMFIVVCIGLLLQSCVEQPLIADEDYYARKGPAANSPDPTGHINQSNQNSTSIGRR